MPNNPFGIPDTMFNAIIKAAVEQQAQQGKHFKPETPSFPDPVKAAKKSAEWAKQLYDAYVEVGFTAEQAFEIVKGILTKSKN